MPEWRKQLVSSEETKRNHTHRMSYSEIITIWIFYHQSGYRTFKWFYQKHIQVKCCNKFPNLLSYSRFIEIVPKTLVPITVFMQSRQCAIQAIAFVDSTPLRVCKNLRIPRQKTFKDVAGRIKSSTGWFYGFKLHLIVNNQGEILSFCITPGNIVDRKPVPQLAKSLTGKLFGDRGYISKKLTQLLLDHKVKLLIKLKKNIKKQIIDPFDKLLLRKRSIIETINDPKNVCDLEHSRHRSLTNYMTSIIASLVAYSYQEKKPTLDLRNANLLTETTIA